MVQKLQYNFLVHILVKTLEKLDVPSEPILAAAGIDYDSSAKEPGLLSKQQLTHLFQELIQKVQTPGLGLLLGQNTSNYDLGAFGYMGLTAPTLRDSVKAMKKYHQLVTAFTETDLKIMGKELHYRISAEAPQASLHSFYVEWQLAADTCFLRLATGQDIYPQCVYIDYPAPDYVHLYEEVFRCPIHFDQPHNELRYPASILDLPLRQYDPMIKNAMEEICERLAAKLSDKNDVLGDVKALLREKPGFFPSLEHIAEKLNVSSRTLHRRLKDKNTSYQSLLNDTRRELAQHYLAETDRQVQQIGEQCGFSEAQNFSIAFKRWTGLPPSDYRLKFKTGS